MKMNRILLAALLGGAFLTTAGQMAHAQTADKMAAMNAQDKTFAKMVAQGNLSEVAAGKIAQGKTQQPDVKMVADTLVKEHGEAYADLQQTAKGMGASVPSEPDSKHKKAATKLEKMSGTSFDKAFIKGQIKDHQATIALFEKEIAEGTNPELKAYAQKWLPGIKEHTKMIYQAANALGIPNSGGDGSGPPAKP